MVDTPDQVPDETDALRAADALGRIADHKSADLATLLPWNWSRVPGIGYAA